MNMQKKPCDQETGAKVPKSGHKSLIRKVKAGGARKAQTGEGPDPFIPNKYWDLAKVFSEKESGVLPHTHCPMDCAAIVSWASYQNLSCTR